MSDCPRSEEARPGHNQVQGCCTDCPKVDLRSRPSSRPSVRGLSLEEATAHHQPFLQTPAELLPRLEGISQGCRLCGVLPTRLCELPCHRGPCWGWWEGTSCQLPLPCCWQRDKSWPGTWPGLLLLQILENEPHRRRCLKPRSCDCPHSLRRRLQGQSRSHGSCPHLQMSSPSSSLREETTHLQSFS